MKCRIRTLAWLAGICVFGIFLWAAMRALDQKPLPPLSQGEKSFKRSLAEGVSVRLRSTPGVETISCRACRLEKRRMGPFSFGGLNVLVLDDLSVVLPPPDFQILEGSGPSTGKSKKDKKSKKLLSSLGLTKSFLMGQGVGTRFSGLSVNGLSVSIFTNGMARPLFCAGKAEMKKDGFALTHCRLFENGITNHMGKALLDYDGKIRLHWKGGTRRFP